MSFLKRKKYFSFFSWNGSFCEYTAKELYEQILEDSKSDYNWIAPARELVRVCRNEQFPIEYSIPIKIAILNCFANIEHKVNCGGDRYVPNPKDEEAVQYCYNSLYGINTEEAISARKRYLMEIITSVSDLRIFDPLYHPGPTFRNLLKTWTRSKFDEYFPRQNIDFQQLRSNLLSNLTGCINTAAEHGDFEEDEKADKERMANIAKMVIDI